LQARHPFPQCLPEIPKRIQPNVPTLVTQLWASSAAWLEMLHVLKRDEMLCHAFLFLGLIGFFLFSSFCLVACTAFFCKTIIFYLKRDDETFIYIACSISEFLGLKDVLYRYTINTICMSVLYVNYNG
jgi:hypothetical protein